MDTFLEALFSTRYLYGALTALSTACIAQLFGTILGVFIALARTSPRIGLRGVAVLYLWVFRALPTLLVLIFVWNALPQIWGVFGQSWFSPFVAACVGLTLHEAAMMGEIVRSGLGSVDEGQHLAGRALGLAPGPLFRWVVLPQVTKTILPPLGNRLIDEVKLTSVASVIALQELLTTAEIDVSSNFLYVQYFGAAAVYYLVMVSTLMFVQARIERRFNWTSTRGAKRGVRRAESIA